LAPRAGIRDLKQINGLERLPGTKAPIDAKGLSASLANLYRPPPDYESKSPGAVGTATGAEFRGVLLRTTQTCRKPDHNVESAVPGIERSAFSPHRNSRVRRRYDRPEAVATATHRIRSRESKCDPNIRKRAACLRAAELSAVIPLSDCWRSNRHVPMLDGGPLRPDGDGTATLEPNPNTAETQATTPSSDMVAPLLAVAASAEHGAAP
jgi:hypothetical protein